MRESKTISEINNYVGYTINPLQYPEQIYELYSVPSFDNEYPEIIKGSEIGSSKVTIEEGDVLICKINPRINRVWVVKHNTDYPLIASSEWIVVRNRTLNPEYLKWYFSSPTFRTMLISQVAGIGGSLTRAQPKQVAGYSVPIPSSSEQESIVLSLNKISDLIALRKKQLQKLNDLVKSRFVEMFGGECENRIPLKDCCIDVRGGSTPSMQHPEYYGGNVPFIKSGDVRGDTVMTGALWLTEQALTDTPAKYVPQGSILVVNRSAALLHEFRAAIALQPVVINQDIKAFIPKPSFSSEYLLWAIKIQTQYLLTRVTTVLTSRIDLKDLLELPIAPVSIEKQQQYCAFTTRINTVKMTIQQSLDKLELMKKALMQKYFE